MDDDLDDELLALAGDSSFAISTQNTRNSKTNKTTKANSSLSSDDEEYAIVKTWKSDLMSDAKDRAWLNSMNELERETILADRRRKLDLLQEHRELKARIGQKLGRRSERKKDDKKNKVHELAKLKRKRQSKTYKSHDESDQDDQDEDDSDQSQSESESLYDQDDLEPEKEEAKTTEATYLDALKIQLKRSDLEKWIGAPFFEKTVKGCFVRISLGMDPETKQQVYRICFVNGVSEYHRSYKFGKNLINRTLNLSHGKATKEFLLDLTSNSEITEKEWARYEKTMKSEQQAMITTDHVSRKFKDIENARKHIFTNEEINEMVIKKRAFDKMPKNVASEKTKLNQMIIHAEESGDLQAAQELQIKLETLKEKISDSTTKDIKLEKFNSVNLKNRSINYNEGREAEKAAILAKKEKGARDYDPFARRKTAPKHVVNGIDEDEKAAKKVAVNRSLSPAKTTLKKSSSPNLKATAVVMDEDDFLDSIDISALEADL